MLDKFITKNYSGTIERNCKIPGTELTVNYYFPDISKAIIIHDIKAYMLLPNSYLKSNEYRETNYKNWLQSNTVNVELFQVTSGSIILKEDIVHSMLLNKFGKSKSIYARKTAIAPLSSKEYKQFFVDNHIKGSGRSSKCIALWKGGEPVCALSYSTSLGKKVEVERFANIKNHNVVGGFSKLLKWLVEYASKLNIPKIVSYSYNNYGTGNVYKTCGFKFDIEQSFGYAWSTDGINEIHRVGMQKHKLLKQFPQYVGKDGYGEFEICVEQNWVPVFDAGYIRHILEV